MSRLHWQSGLLGRQGELRHAFSSASGARGATAAGRLGNPELFAGLGLRGRPLLYLNQIHGREVIWIEEQHLGEMPPVGQGDGLLTTLRQPILAVKTADCLPILLYDRESGAIGAIHAGWAGTLKGVLAAALDQLAQRLHSSLRQLVVAFGPAIRACCYQVPAERLALFGESPLFSDCPELAAMLRRGRLDLAQLNRHLLRCRGIADAQLDDLSICTHCSSEDLASFRRDGPACGRQINLIGLG
jgi:polyphenol oxidase